MPEQSSTKVSRKGIILLLLLLLCNNFILFFCILVAILHYFSICATGQFISPLNKITGDDTTDLLYFSENIRASNWHFSGNYPVIFDAYRE